MTMERPITRNLDRKGAVERPHCSDDEYDAYVETIIARSVDDYIVVGSAERRTLIVNSVVNNLLAQSPNEISREAMMQRVLHLFTEAVLRTHHNDGMIAAYESRAQEQQQEIDRLRAERALERQFSDEASEARSAAVQDFVASYADNGDVLDIVSEYFGDVVPEIGQAIDNATRAERLQAEKALILSGVSPLPSADEIDSRIRDVREAEDAEIAATEVPRRPRLATGFQRMSRRVIAVTKSFLEDNSASGPIATHNNIDHLRYISPIR